MSVLLACLLSSCRTAPRLQVISDPASGHWVFADQSRPVLVYNYGTNEPGSLLDRIRPENRRYAVARGDYVHPILGPAGESLTRDWAVDHPHHRGIYWAWPEVDWRGQRGDLHALQHVFARPTGRIRTSHPPDSPGARLVAENQWFWEDGTPIVRELVTLTVTPSGPAGWIIDLRLDLEAVGDDVALARRDTDKYGGLNVRLNEVAGQTIRTTPRREGYHPSASWGQVAGTFAGGNRPVAFVLFEHPDNPGFPGDWVKYPELNWLQPTFPAPGTRHRLTRGHPLTLRYRFWIRPGPPVSDADAEAHGRQFAQVPAPEPPRDVVDSPNPTSLPQLSTP